MAQNLIIRGLDSGSVVPRAGSEHSVWSRLLRRLINWRRRRKIGEIALLDDYLLEDIGLTRSDIRRVGSMPLDQDPIAALKSVAERNRIARRHKARPQAEVALSLAAGRAGRSDDAPGVI